MATSNRSKQIVEYLKVHKTATVNELSEKLFVSAATIRRDLTEMQKLGQIERSHGTASLVETADEISIFIRVAKNAKEKEKTASIALLHLPEFQTVFIDNSSTCLALAERMNLAHKTVITNGLQVAMKISQKSDVNLIMPGGEVHYNTNAVMGCATLAALHNFRIDLMLASCAAVNADGSYEYSLDTMQLKRAAFEHSKQRVLLADKTKLGTDATYRTAALRDYDMFICNTDDVTAWEYKKKGVNILYKA